MNGFRRARQIEHLKKVPDPRVKRSRRHELMDNSVIAMCTTLGAADGWVEIVQFGQAKPSQAKPSQAKSSQERMVCIFLGTTQRHSLARHVRAGVPDAGLQGTGASVHRLAAKHRRANPGRGRHRWQKSARLARWK